jgi:D-alanine--poly(phosphoribitol) ligase subunit 1
MTSVSTEPANAARYFFDSARSFPDRPALWLDGREYTYNELASRIVCLADSLSHVDGDVCATVGDRSLTAYCAGLACMLAGKIHVPLGASFPTARMLTIIEMARPAALICDHGAQSRLAELLAGATGPLTILSPDTLVDDVSDPLPEPHCRVAVGERTEADWRSGDFSFAATNAIAYLLFTSGSSGVPKGVAVGHTALCAYVDAVLARYPEMDESQRCTQCFEPTFDLSMHDLFVTWAAGACLYSIPKHALMLPVDFVNAHALTVWFSAPSAAVALQRHRLLNRDSLPSLRLSLFCGEALPRTLADAWRAAAPNARCENLYGPTEATIACTAHHIADDDPTRPVVAIGKPFPEMEIAVIREDGTLCGRDEVGELYLGGVQLAAGYWRDEAQTLERFVSIDIDGKHARRWYRTGDLASIDDQGVAHFHGRSDRQIKLRGYRIELQEVEALLREACGTTEVAVAVMPPAQDGSLVGIAAFIVAEGLDKKTLMRTMKSGLPAYMVPSEVHFLASLPLNSNGKTDYRALTEVLKAKNAARTQIPVLSNDSPRSSMVDRDLL